MRLRRHLLRHSRSFAERSGIASKDLLTLSDKAVKLGAIGATQNMIGNAIHCLVKRSQSKDSSNHFRGIVPAESIFVSDLIHSGPILL